MTLIYSFPPVADDLARILILGSMPGKASLAANQYYAHPRNLFWPLMGELTGAKPDLPYEKRIEILKRSGIALWDVLKSCTRQSSLDSDIRKDMPNDLPQFLQAHPGITRIYFNGGKAEQSFRRHWPSPAGVGLTRLPSTSPAHAALSYRKKLAAWKMILVS